MNYLAHLALVPSTSSAGKDREHALRIGNLLGDFIKGTESTLRQQYSSDLVDGIILHRSIDKSTDSHPAFLSSKNLLAPERKRYAGIVIDIIYDHFLSLHWNQYYTQPLDEFIAEMYHTLETHPEWQLGTLATAFPVMKKQNWLKAYSTKQGIHQTFKRVSNRGKFTAPIAKTSLDFEKYYSTFEKHFHIIYQDLITLVNQHKFNHPQ